MCSETFNTFADDTGNEAETDFKSTVIFSFVVAKYVLNDVYFQGKEPILGSKMVEVDVSEQKVIVTLFENRHSIFLLNL